MTPNQPPQVDPGNVRLAVVGESPGVEEEAYRLCARGHGYAGEHWVEGRLHEVRHCPECGSSDWTRNPTPLVGPSGKMLNWLLRGAGLRRERVWAGNCCQHRATSAELDNPAYPPLVTGIARLSAELAEWHPNVVLCLGNTALRAFHPTGWARTDKRTFQIKVTDWRGSIFAGCPDRPFKCVATYHPAACLRQPEWTALLRFDLERAVKEAQSPQLDLPERRVLMPTDEGLIELASVKRK